MDGLNKISSYNIYNIFQVFWYTLNMIYLFNNYICMGKNVEQGNNIFQCWILIIFKNVHKCIIKIFTPIKTCIWFWELNLKDCCMVDFKNRWKWIQIYDNFGVIYLKNMQNPKHTIKILNWLKNVESWDRLKIHSTSRHYAF